MIHILIGTRAQLIKMVPLMQKMQEEGIEYNFIFMAQHKETIYEILEDFSLKKPDYTICDQGADIVKSAQMIVWSFKVVWNGLLNKRKIFKNDNNGIVLIHGDAPPLLLGAILAKAQGLKVGAVEAGLRSFNIFKPFPEELTRLFTGKAGLIDVFYCQDNLSLKNADAYKGVKIHTHGNTIIDSIQIARKINYGHSTDVRSSNDKPFALISLHRFETISHAEGITKVADLVKKVANQMRVKFILHPPTRVALEENNIYQKLDSLNNVELLPRMRFIKFNELISKCDFLITDGGSNQEESAYLGVPCLLFRNETERSDGLNENVVLSKFNEKTINDFLDNYKRHRRPVKVKALSPTEIIFKETLRFK